MSSKNTTNNKKKSTTPVEVKDPIEQLTIHITSLFSSTVNEVEKRNILGDAVSCLRQNDVKIIEIIALITEQALVLKETSTVFDLSKMCENRLPPFLFMTPTLGDQSTTPMTPPRDFDPNRPEYAQHWKWHALVQFYHARAMSVVAAAQVTTGDDIAKTKVSTMILRKLLVAMRLVSYSMTDRSTSIMIADEYLRIVEPIISGELSFTADRTVLEEQKTLLTLLLNYSSAIATGFSASKLADETVQKIANSANAIIEALYCIAFSLYEHFGQYREGLQLTKQALSQLAISHHKYIWQTEILFRSKLGLNITETLSRIRGYDKRLQAFIFSSIAKDAPDTSAGKTYFKEAISVLKNDPITQIDYMVEYSTWTYDKLKRREDAISILLEAVDVFHSYEREAKESWPLYLSSPKDMSTTSTKARQPGSAISEPKFVSTYHFQQMMTIHRLLSTWSTNYHDMLDYAVTAQFYVLRMIATAFNTARLIHAHCKGYSLPPSISGWLGYEFPDDVRRFWSSTSSTITFEELANETSSDDYEKALRSYLPSIAPHLAQRILSSLSISAHCFENPFNTYSELYSLYKILYEHGYLPHAIPVLSLMKVLAEDVLDNNLMKMLTNLLFSDLYQIVGYDSSDCKYGVKYDDLKEVVNYRATLALGSTISIRSDHSKKSHSLSRNELKASKLNIVELLVHHIPMVEGGSQYTVCQSILESMIIEAEDVGDHGIKPTIYWLLAEVYYLSGESELAARMIGTCFQMLSLQADAVAMDTYRRMLLVKIKAMSDSIDTTSLSKLIDDSIAKLQNICASTLNKSEGKRQRAHLTASIAEVLLQKAHDPLLMAITYLNQSVTIFDELDEYSPASLIARNSLIETSLSSLDGSQSNFWTTIDDLYNQCSKAKDLYELRIRESVPSDMSPNVKSNLVIMTHYAQLLNLKGRIELVLHERDLDTLPTLSFEQKVNTLRESLPINPNRQQSDRDTVVQYLLDLEDRASEQTDLITRVKQRIEASLLLFTSAFNATSDNITRSESKCLMGRCMFTDFRTMLAMSRRNNIELDEDSISETRTAIVEYFTESLSMARNNLSKGLHIVRSLKTICLCSLELLEFYNEFSEDSSKSLHLHYFLLYQSTMNVLEMCDEMNAHLHHDQLFRCATRYMSIMMVHCQWKRVEELYVSMASIWPVLHNLEQSIIQNQEKLAESTKFLTSPNDTVLLGLISPGYDFNGSRRGLPLRRAKENFDWYVSVLTKNVSIDEKLASGFLLRKIAVNVSNDAHATVRHLLLELERELPRLFSPEIRKLVVVSHCSRAHFLPFEQAILFDSQIGHVKCVTREFSILCFMQKMSKLQSEAPLATNQKQNAKSKKANTPVPPETEIELPKPNFNKLYYMVEQGSYAESMSSFMNDTASISKMWRGLTLDTKNRSCNLSEVQQLLSDLQGEKERCTLMIQFDRMVPDLIPHLGYLANASKLQKMELVIVQDRECPPEQQLQLAKLFSLLGVPTVVIDSSNVKQLPFYEAVKSSLVVAPPTETVTKRPTAAASSKKKGSKPTTPTNLPSTPPTAESPINQPPPTTGFIAEKLFQNVSQANRQHVLIFGIP